MTPFEFQLRTKIVFGSGKINSLGQLAGEIGARRALVVSDDGVINAGHTQKGIDALEASGIETMLFSEVHENPTTDEVDQGVAVARWHEPELIVGLGGGSSMDCAKGINFIYSGGGEMKDYWGVGKMLKPMLPMIAVPTTSGTGSETQSFALISDAKTHVKMACGDKKASCRVAILDPELTLTQPAIVTALTGIDALAHSLETFVSKPRNPVSITFSREAWRNLAGNFSKVLKEPDNLNARAGMQLGASYAGIAIENSMLGATHALANPLTAKFGIAHGQAIGLMLPHVIRFNNQLVSDWYLDLLETTGGVNGYPKPQHGADGLAEFVKELAWEAGLPGKLSDCGVSHTDLEELAQQAAKQWTGTFNPREVDATSLLSLYEQAYD